MACHRSVRTLLITWYIKCWGVQDVCVAIQNMHCQWTWEICEATSAWWRARVCEFQLSVNLPRDDVFEVLESLPSCDSWLACLILYAYELGCVSWTTLWYWRPRSHHPAVLQELAGVTCVFHGGALRPGPDVADSACDSNKRERMKGCTCAKRCGLRTSWRHQVGGAWTEFEVSASAC